MLGFDSYAFIRCKELLLTRFGIANSVKIGAGFLRLTITKLWKKQFQFTEIQPIRLAGVGGSLLKLNPFAKGTFLV